MSKRICATVVTYNRKHILNECLLALQNQTRPLDQILVVDNASTDGTYELLEEAFSNCQILRLSTNTGASGGFYAGIKHAYEQGFDWIWVIDDDGRPAPDCLEKLFEQASPNCVIIPVEQDHSGRFRGVSIWRNRDIDVTAQVVANGRPARGDFLFAFTASLIPRQIVEKAGLPNRDFFIWFDDYEYALRVKAKTNAEVVVVPDAVFFHEFGENRREVRFLGKRSMRSEQPAWKLYYGARNPLYTFLRNRRNPQELFLFLLVQFRLLLMDIVYEQDRWERVQMRLMGFRDGIRGRLGKCV